MAPVVIRMTSTHALLLPPMRGPRRTRRFNLFGGLVGPVGVHFRSLQRSLELGQGTVAYHVQMLLAARLVRVRHVGARVRFFASDRPMPPSLEPFHTAADGIAGALRTQPGVPQAELARRLGVSRQAVHRQVERHGRKGLLPSPRGRPKEPVGPQ